jgi:hypothetical protein
MNNPRALKAHNSPKGLTRFCSGTVSLDRPIVSTQSNSNHISSCLSPALLRRTETSIPFSAKRLDALGQAEFPANLPSASSRSPSAIKFRFPVRQSKAENRPTASLTSSRLNQFSFLPKRRTHMQYARRIRGCRPVRLGSATQFYNSLAQYPPKLLGTRSISRGVSSNDCGM